MTNEIRVLSAIVFVQITTTAALILWSSMTFRVTPAHVAAQVAELEAMLAIELHKANTGIKSAAASSQRLELWTGKINNQILTIQEEIEDKMQDRWTEADHEELVTEHMKSEHNVP